MKLKSNYIWHTSIIAFQKSNTVPTNMVVLVLVVWGYIANSGTEQLIELIF